MADERATQAEEGPGAGDGRLSGPEAARLAKEQLAEITGLEAASVSGLSRTDDGWRVVVELVELERVPPTTNVMGRYEVELDRDGELVGYEQVERYHRGQVVGGED